MAFRLQKRHIIVPGFASAFLIIAVMAFSASLDWIGRPFPGFLVGKALNVYPIAAPGWSFHDADLQAKDRLKAINGKPLANHMEMIRAVRSMSPGTTALFTFERNGIPATKRLTITVFSFPDWLLTFGIFLLMAAVFLTVGLIVFYLKTRVDSSAIFALLCCAMGLFFLTYFDAYTDIGLVFFLDISMYLVPALMLHLAFIFPDRLPFMEKYRHGVFLLYLLPGLLWQLKAHYELTDYGVWAFLDIISDALIFIAYITFVIILFRRSRHSANTLLRKRAQMTLMGLGMAFFIPSLATVFSLHNGILTHNFSFFTAILFPLYLGYAVLKHNFFNADRVVVNSIFYTILLAVLAAIFLGFASLTGIIFNDGVTGRSVLITVFFTALVITLSRMQHAAHVLIARLLYRTPFSGTKRYLSGSSLLRNINRLNDRTVPLLKKLFASLGIEQAAVLFRSAGGLHPFCSFALPEELPRVSRQTIAFLEQRPMPVTPLDLGESPLPSPVIEDLRILFDTTRTLIIFPINSESGLLGIVLVGERPDGSAFRKQDIDILSSLSAHLAVARENTLLMERARNQDRLERELEIASEIQRQFLPDNVGDSEWYELAVEYSPARIVGGDLYDIFQDDPDKLTVCMGDVSGKGVPAALFGAVSQGIIRAGSETRTGPGTALTDINNRLLRIRPNNLNLALCIARFDRKKQLLTLANAGMPFPLRIRNSGKYLETGGLPLAIRHTRRKYREIRVRFRTGDIFLFFSDGLTDTVDTGGQRFGESQVADTAYESRKQPPADIIRHILEAERAHSGGKTASDDRTLLAVRIR